MTPLIIFYLAAPDVLAQALAWIPVVTVLLKFLSALCGFALSVMLLSHRLRRWLRRRRPPRA